MKKYYVTIGDTASYWVVENGKVSDVAHDIWDVEEDDLVDDENNAIKGMEHLQVGDLIFVDTNQKFGIEGIDLQEDVESLQYVSHGDMLNIMNADLPVHSTEDIHRHIRIGFK